MIMAEENSSLKGFLLMTVYIDTFTVHIAITQVY